MDGRERLLAAIESERERIVAFLGDFVRCKSPNPPGDTTVAVRHITDFLTAEGLPWRLVDPQPSMANIVGSVQGAGEGRHLVLNGHIDVFPVGTDPAADGWTADPWGGEIRDGKLFGRGTADMKAGTSASIWTYALLSRMRKEWRGKLTLTCVSDEETFGPWGARWLIEHEPEVRGDCCLNGEPSSPFSVRYGEKGPMWFRFDIRTPGAHGAYTHASPSATRIAVRLIAALEALEDLDVTIPDNLMRAEVEGRAASDKAMGPGAAAILPKITLNIGLIEGGLKNNMIPGHCSFEADIRAPVGVDPDVIRAEVARIAAGFPEATYEEYRSNPPAWCDPYGEMMEIIQDTVESLGRPRPTPVVSIGGTDARLWRYRGIPAYVYGPFPTGMGSYDEHVDIEDFLHIVRTHTLAAYAFLTAD